MSNQQETTPNTLVQYINNPSQIQDQNLIQLIEKLSRQNINLIYDGNTYCQLTGEIIGTQNKIELKFPNKQTFVVLQEKFKTLIKKQCFVNNRYDPFYQTIYGVEFILTMKQQQPEFSDPIDIDITDDLLKLVFEKEYEKIKEDTKAYYEEFYQQMEEFDKNYPLKCHKTQKEIVIYNDGINIQSFWFSLEGALKMLDEERDKLFSHQVEFLINYKKILNK